MKEQAAGVRFYNFYPAKIGGDEDEPEPGETLYFRREDVVIPEYKQSIDTPKIQYKQAGRIDTSETQPFTQITNLVSSPINFNHKNICAIVHKITHMKCITTCDVVTNLINYTNQTIATPWGQKQSSTKTFHNFKAFLPVGLNSVLDLGCGSGADMNALVDMIPIKKVYLADIKNSLDRAYAVVRQPNTVFCQVKEHARIGVQSGSIDLICMFHCIHHMMETIEFRIKDCIRMLAPGGLLFLKDHNIKTQDDAQLVDCEHFIYLLPELSHEVNNGTATQTVTNLFEAAAIQNINSDAINPWLIREIATQFDKIEPMKYYSSDHIVNLIVTNGMQLQSLIITNSLTNVYMGIFKKVV
jgi:SAM-dependent methyltransferase